MVYNALKYLRYCVGSILAISAFNLLSIVGLENRMYSLEEDKPQILIDNFEIYKNLENYKKRLADILSFGRN